jgi:hypothetical protein
MKKQPNYTCMLKNLLKLFCIWTWDTLWVFFFLCSFVLLCVPFDETTTKQHLRHHLQDWRLRQTPKLLRQKLHCIWTWRYFVFCFLFSIFHSVLFHFIYIYIYTYISSIYLFFIFIFIFSLLCFIFQSSLCLSNACSAYSW